MLPFCSISALTRSCFEVRNMKNMGKLNDADQAMMASTPSRFHPNKQNECSLPT